MPRDDGSCATCLETTGTKRYCAPARCYCGHDACPAEWHPMPDLRETAPVPTRPDVRMSETWASREDDSWIDKL